MIDDQRRRSGHEEVIAPTRPAPCTLLYDGACGFCTRLATRVATRLPAWRVVPYQRLDDLALDALGVTREACASAVQLVAANGTVRSGAAAVNATLAALAPPLHGALAAIEAIPPLFALESALYAAVAARRSCSTTSR
jgi:predicted DCC family thiol-disulfide oxidoreductase YuxK